MKMLNSLYRIRSKELSDSFVRYDIQLDASHFIYQAHFPGAPITPGVCIIQIAEELLEDHIGRKLSIRKIKNVKFLNVISPLVTPCISYVFEKTQSSPTIIPVTAQVFSGETPLAKLSFICSAQ